MLTYWIFRIVLSLLLHGIFLINGEPLGMMPLNVADQVSKNRESLVQLQKAQYKLINQLNKLQNDIGELEEEIVELKTTINGFKNGVKKNSGSNRRISGLLQKRFGSSINRVFDDNSADNVFYVSSVDGFIWKLDNVSRFWNKTGIHMISKRFYSDGRYGYKVRLKLDNPFNIIRIRIEIMKGEFDSLLPWPFNNDVEVSLLSQVYPYYHYTVTNILKPDTCLNRYFNSMKRYHNIYSQPLKQILFYGSKTGRDPLVIKWEFNNGNDINNNKIFNKHSLWKIDRFYYKMKLNDYAIMNYSFYTGDYGYKLEFLLYPNGISKNGEFNLFMAVLKGDNDEFLWWPFNYNVTVKVLNVNRTVNVCSNDERTKNRKQSFSDLVGFIYFNKSEVVNSYRSIIKGNQMFVKFKAKSKLSYILNTESNEKETEYKDIIWEIERYEEIKKYNEKIISDIFVTAPFGYRIKMAVYFNGERTAKGKFASIFVYVVNGSYDHILPWPFSKRISLGILDGKGKPIIDDIAVVQNMEYRVPLKPTCFSGILVAYSRFMRLTEESIRKNIINDKLIIRLRISNKS